MRDTQVCNYFVINLQSGVHLITEPIVTNASVSIIGNGAVQVVCQFDTDNQTGNLHSLYFNRADSISFENVNFEYCPLPIRIFEADNVVIINSSFRYHLHRNKRTYKVIACLYLNHKSKNVVNVQNKIYNRNKRIPRRIKENGVATT